MTNVQPINTLLGLPSDHPLVNVDTGDLGAFWVTSLGPSDGRGTVPSTVTVINIPGSNGHPGVQFAMDQVSSSSAWRRHWIAGSSAWGDWQSMVASGGGGGTGYAADVVGDTEKLTREIVDRKRVYTVRMNCGQLPNTNAKYVNIPATGFDRIWIDPSNSGAYYIAGGIPNLPLPYSHYTPAQCIAMYIQGSQLVIIAGNDKSAYTGIVSVKYTKTADPVLTDAEIAAIQQSPISPTSELAVASVDVGTGVTFGASVPTYMREGSIAGSSSHGLVMRARIGTTWDFALLNPSASTVLMGVSTGATTISFPSTTASTSTTTGAVTIAGGLGVAGTVTAVKFVSSDTTQSTSVTTGAHVVAGGLGVAKDVWCSSLNTNLNVNVAGYVSFPGNAASVPAGAIGFSATSGLSIVLKDGTTDSFGIWRGSSAAMRILAGGTNVMFPSTTASTSTTTGAVTVAGGLGVGGQVTAYTMGITGVTASTSATTGALQVAGGIGAGADSYFAQGLTVGKNITVLGRIMAGSSTPTDNLPGNMHYSTAGGLTLQIKTGSTSDFLIASPTGSGTIAIVPTGTNSMKFMGNVASTSTTTGSVIIVGGIGISGAVYANAASFSTKVSFMASANGAPAEGDFWYDTTRKSLCSFDGGVQKAFSGVIFSATADGTNGAATAETSILGSGVGTRTIPANGLVAGKSIRIAGYGTLTTAATPGTTTLKLKIGSVVVSTSVAVTPTASKTNVGFNFDFVLTCRTVGASGTVIGMGEIVYNVGETIMSTSTAVATVNTTIANAVDVTVTNSVASGTIWTTRVATVEILN